MFEVIEKNCPIRIRPKPREIKLRGNFSLQFSRNRLLGFPARLRSSSQFIFPPTNPLTPNNYVIAGHSLDLIVIRIIRPVNISS